MPPPQASVHRGLAVLSQLPSMIQNIFPQYNVSMGISLDLDKDGTAPGMPSKKLALWEKLCEFISITFPPDCHIKPCPMTGQAL